MLFNFRNLMIFESLFWVFIVFQLKYSFFPSTVFDWYCNDKADFFHLTVYSILVNLFILKNKSLVTFTLKNLYLNISFKKLSEGVFVC